MTIQDAAQLLGLPLPPEPNPVYGQLRNARWYYDTGKAMAESLGGEVVSRRIDLKGVEMTTYRVPYTNHRGELLYTWQSGPLGYTWNIV